MKCLFILRSSLVKIPIQFHRLDDRTTVSIQIFLVEIVMPALQI